MFKNTVKKGGKVLAYFHCFSGISGDMVLGALLDAGFPVDVLKERLSLLPIAGYSLSKDYVRKNSISAVKFRVSMSDDRQPPRSYKEIKSIIIDSGLSQREKDLSLKIFGALARAEAKIHGTDTDSVHFHEVGAIDSIIDIVGAVIGLECLGVKEVYSSVLTVGSGFVKARHGELPLPTPATLELLKGVPIVQSPEEGERVTPTGAAIITTLAQRFGPMPFMNISSVGYGAGDRDHVDMPNVLRLVLGKKTAPPIFEDSLVVETNLDDMPPEFFGYLMEKLFEKGAYDVFYSPIQMKKNRPGTMVRIICDESLKDDIISILFRETTTLGVRCYNVKRYKLQRAQKTIETSFGKMKVKVVHDLEGDQRIIPEFEECARIAREKGLPLRSVYEAVLREADGEK